MRTVVASAMVVVLGVVQTGWAGLCFCDTMTEASSESEETAEHSCCASAEPGADAAAATAPCERGCCDEALQEDVRDRLADKDPLKPPGQRLVPSLTGRFAAPPLVPRGLWAAKRDRGPPPLPISTRLALLQLWRC